MLSIRDAARQAGVSRSAIFRAIRSGKISAPRRENGDYAIDPSELFRGFEPPPTGTRDADEPCLPRQSEQGSETRETSGETLTTLRLRLTALEAELRAQRELVARLDQDKRDLQSERDKWSAQAERLALAPPRRSWA